GPTVPNTLVSDFNDQFRTSTTARLACKVPGPSPSPRVAHWCARAWTRRRGCETRWSHPWRAPNVPPPGSGPIEIDPHTWERRQDWSLTSSVAVVDPAFRLGTVLPSVCDLSNAEVVSARVRLNDFAGRPL